MKEAFGDGKSQQCPEVPPMLVERCGGISNQYPLSPQEKHFWRQVGQGERGACETMGFAESIDGSQCLYVGLLCCRAHQPNLQVSNKKIIECHEKK